VSLLLLVAAIILKSAAFEFPVHIDLLLQVMILVNVVLVNFSQL
jgi:hypothetical protein